MPVQHIHSDVFVHGDLQSESITLPSGSVGDAQVKANANIDADKLEHLHAVGSNFGLERTAAPVAKDFVIYQAQKAGTVRSFHAMLDDTGTTTNATFNLLKNGTSILATTAGVTITSTNSDGEKVAATISSAAYVAGDRFAAVLAATASTGAAGPFCMARFDELPSST